MIRVRLGSRLDLGREGANVVHLREKSGDDDGETDCTKDRGGMKTPGSVKSAVTSAPTCTAAESFFRDESPAAAERAITGEFPQRSHLPATPRNQRPPATWPPPLSASAR